MNTKFNKYNQPEKPNIYLGTPNNKKICALTGIDESTFKMTEKLSNTYELSFDISRTLNYTSPITNETVEKENRAFRLISLFMRLYVDGYGWFIIDPPEEDNDSYTDKYSITAQSAEIEFQQHNLHNFKVNQGTTDSYEMLVDGNVQMVGDVEFAKEQIKFYNASNPELSFLDICLKTAGVTGWTVGYVDTVPKSYEYFDEGVRKEKQTLLADEIGVFDVDSQDLYSFLTQDVAKFFKCIFEFDFDKMQINAYHPENYGKDTNVNISFRNFQKSNNIKIDDTNIFTRYYVQGSNELGIEYVNFGHNYIENLENYLNERYLSKEVIAKYKLWSQDVESNRNNYIENTRLYNKQYAKISELTNKVPLDDCSTDWSSFSDDKLKEAQENYQAQLKGYESYYVDENGDFDEIALKNSVDADDYYQIKNVILPSIQIEMDNRNLPSGQEFEDYIDSYKTDWKLYGLDELENKLIWYRKQKKLAEDEKCTEPYNPEDDKNNHTEDFHTELYNKYIDAIHQLDPDYEGSCMEFYNKVKAEIDGLKELQDSYDKARKEIVKSVAKETWVHVSTTDDDGYIMDQDGNYITDGEGNYIALSQSEISFTADDLEELSHIYVDGDYSNENMFLTSSDDSVTAIDEQLKLLNAAQDDLYITSHPQYQYTTDLDNFLGLYEFKEYSEKLNIGDYLYLSVRDDYVVKLRIISMEYNPLCYDNSLQITFSNMIQSRSSRDDIAYILNQSGGSSKNSSTGSSSSNNYLNNEGVSLTPALIQKLVQSGAFQNQLNNIINNNFGSYLGSNGGSISISELNAKMIKVVDIIGENAFFEYLQSKFISTDTIVAGSGKFKDLQALVAQIDNLLAGNISSEMAHIIKLTAENVQIDEAVIRDLIAANITVSMLKASEIDTDKFHVKSNDGSLEIVGNTMQFKDQNDVVRIQIGRDTNNEFTFCLYDETGEGVLIDSTGIHGSAISDGLIVNDMIADGTLEKNKFAFDVLEGDGNGNLDAGKVIVDGHGVDVEFTSIKNTITETNSRIDNLTSQIATIKLMGEQIFKQIQGVVSPETITVTAVCRNGAMIGDWYIDDVLVTDTEYVSDDKMSITIPSSYMLDNNIVPIKVTDSTGELYDLHTLYLISDSTGAKGDDAYTVILQNENVSFSVDNSSNTVLSDQSYSSTVQIFQGTTERTDFTIGEINSANGITISVQDRTVILSVKNGDKITENNGFFTVPILIDDLTFYKDITWNLAKQGETGSSGEPSLNIVVGNESQNIPCSNDGLALENFLIEIPFTGYKGFDRVDCSVSVGLLPDGVTLGSNTASTPDTDGLIILNIAKDATLGGESVLNGKVTLTFTIDGKNMSRYFTWVKTKDGAEGSMILYELVSSSPVLNKNYDDTLSPPTITFNSYYRQSNSTDKTSYAGQFIIAESDNDGATYTNKYLSSVVEDFVEYTPSSASITSIRCTLCSADDISIELDVLTVPVLTDVDSIKPIITEITTTMSGVQTQVDAVEKSITDKVWQDDITNSINNYDSTTTESIRSRVSQVEQDVDGIKSTVSDVQTTLTEKADGSTVTELSEKVSTLEQNADGFKQTVEKNYVAKTDLNISSRNLLRNSKTLIFDSYGLVNSEGISYLIDESGNILTDENDNILIL